MEKREWQSTGDSLSGKETAQPSQSSKWNREENYEKCHLIFKTVEEARMNYKIAGEISNVAIHCVKKQRCAHSKFDYWKRRRIFLIFLLLNWNMLWSCITSYHCTNIFYIMFLVIDLRQFRNFKRSRSWKLWLHTASRQDRPFQNTMHHGAHMEEHAEYRARSKIMKW